MKDNKKEKEFNIQELDRRRIARDLHDTSLQNLAHMIHKLELASMYIDKDVIQAKLEIASISKSIDLIIEEIRNIIFDLRPMSFDDLGLKETIEDMVEKIKKNSGIIITTDIDNVILDNESSMLGIFRIVQECAHNAHKHSKAKHLRILLKDFENQVFLEVEDDGIGFDMKSVNCKEKHFGLFIMKERVEIMSGNIEINSDIGKGTKIIVTIPKITVT